MNDPCVKFSRWALLVAAALALPAIASAQQGTISGTVTDQNSGQPVVGAMRQGGVRALDVIVAETVLEMEYLNGQEATTRFGTGHGGGVILVRLR